MIKNNNETDFSNNLFHAEQNTSPHTLLIPGAMLCVASALAAAASTALDVTGAPLRTSFFVSFLLPVFGWSLRGGTVMALPRRYTPLGRVGDACEHVM